MLGLRGLGQLRCVSLPQKRPSHLLLLLQHHTRPGWRLGSTLRSLDSILGSRDEESTSSKPEQQQKQQQGQEIKQLRVPGWAWTEVSEPRVVPLATNALYYLFLVVFVAYYVVTLSDGQEAADDLIARLANDHAAVADGDALRLYTSAFVADSIQALVFGLLALATVASELESLLGYSTFWALLSLSTLTGSLADAAFSKIPITQGPGPAVAAVAAALLAYHARNWKLEQELLQAKAGKIPKEFLQLEADYNNTRLQQTQQQQTQTQQGGEAGPGAAPAAAAAAAAGPPASMQQQQQQQQPLAYGSRDGDDSDLVETDLDLPILNWLGISLMVPQEGKAFVTIGGMACGVLAAIRDATIDDAASDWPGLMAAFAAGLALGWQVAPLYQMTLIEASTARITNSSSGSSSSDSGFAEPDIDILLPVLRDVKPATARANAVIGYAGLLFAVLGGWLLTQGT